MADNKSGATLNKPDPKMNPTTERAEDVNPKQERGGEKRIIIDPGDNLARLAIDRVNTEFARLQPSDFVEAQFAIEDGEVVLYLTTK